MSKVLEGYFYTKSHEWLKVEGDTGLIGITDFAQSALGTIVFLDLPEIGSSLEKMTEFGAVESVKAASDLLSPATGKVLAINQDAIEDPERVNQDAFGTWLVQIKLADPSETADLLDAAHYRLLNK